VGSTTSPTFGCNGSDGANKGASSGGMGQIIVTLEVEITVSMHGVSTFSIPALPSNV
jgi:hypothetical protein